MNPWLALFVLVGIVGLAIWAMRPRYQLRIVVCDGSVESLRGAAARQTDRIVEFLQHDVSLNGRVTIMVNKRPNGYFQLAFRGPVDEGTKQQIRNFLITIL